MTKSSKSAETLSALAAVLDDTTRILAESSAHHIKADGGRAQDGLALAATARPEPIRAVHHFAFAGGRLVGRHLESLPNVMPIAVTGASEVKAFRSMSVPDASDAGGPGERSSTRDLGARASIDVFCASTQALHEHSVATGRYLVLLDNAHDRFCSGPGLADRPMLRDRLPGGVPLRSILLVRDPLETFAALVKRGALPGGPDSLSVYVARYHRFLELHASSPRIRYEDLVATPQGTLQELCSSLSLPLPSNALLQAMGLEAGPGDESVIRARPRSAEAAALLDDAIRSEPTQRLFAALGYRLEAEAPAAASRAAESGKAIDTAWPASAGRTADALLLDVQRQLTELTKLLAKQNSNLFKVSEHLQAVVRKELLNAVRQLEAHASVQAALAGAELLPEMHGWPISPDFAAYLIELIRSNDYDAIIEFGSGTSTVLVARVLAQQAVRRNREQPVLQVAFEHLPEFHAQTSAQLRAAGLADAVTVELAKLVTYAATNGKTYRYYDCSAKLAEIGRVVSSRDQRVLVIVDGPPAGTGEHARYPALPKVLESATQCAVDVLLDDHVREDEKQVAAIWQRELASSGRGFDAITRTLEKGAYLLRVHPYRSAGIDTGTSPTGALSELAE